ncbi:hypothetical protein [uncultured Ruthenibacterium sp.]|uniref:hypothetical protein n=1 Tax=uncultured Ruthenibacterium sp. TaxID=1905347 RepID=UPI00349E537B
MSRALQKSHIQIEIPGEDCPHAFPLDDDTRFSDLFRTLIDKGYFSVFSDKKSVWVLLCGDQDLVTWNSADNSFYDRFPFGELSITSVPVWCTQTVHFVSYSDSMARAKSLYRDFQGSKFFMGHEGFLTEYKSYKVPSALEDCWHAELRNNLSSGQIF